MADQTPSPVIAIVPFSEFGGEDVLVLRNDGHITLPAGVTQPGERVLDAASRIVLETTGLQVAASRVVYLLESTTSGISLAVLCTMGELPDNGDDLQGDVVNLSGSDQDFEPMALREVLVEDLRSGFVRPVAHVVETLVNGRRHVEISW